MPRSTGTGPDPVRPPASELGPVREVLRHARYEVIPTATTAQKVIDAVPTGVPVTVTTSPVKGLEATLELTEQLVAAGFSVVPHLAARLVVDRAHLAEIVRRLRAAGVDDVFVPAGDAPQPAGKYDGSLPLLRDLSDLGSPFARVGITGYPQSHPSIGDDVTVQAMWDKRVHATYIVSNLCFDARAVATWARRVRERGIALPILVGMAGPVERTKLLGMATKIGVAESGRFLRGHLSWFARLAAPGGYSPERLLRGVVAAAPPQRYGITGVHVFTFNQVAETESWRQELMRAGDSGRR